MLSTLRIASLCVLACLASAIPANGQRPQKAPPKAQFPGKTARGILLPNGWTISPAGDQVALADLPLNIYPISDNRHALVTSSGFNAHELALVDLDAKAVVARSEVKQSWFGLVVTAKEDRLWWSGGGANLLHEFTLANRKLIRVGAREPEPPRAQQKSGPRKSTPNFRAGVLLDEKARVLYSLDLDAGQLLVAQTQEWKIPQPGGGYIPVDRGAVLSKMTLGGKPYDIVRAGRGGQLFISDWARRLVLVVEPRDLRVVSRIAVGEHPNQMAVHPTDSRLFVACASSNTVSVIDTSRGHVTETIATTLFPKAPEGSTPDALAVSPDGKSLYVANADNNCIAVIDISTADRSQVKGFIPTGWYPTAVAVTRDGRRLLVGVGKGNQSGANPVDPQRTTGDAFQPGTKLPFKYIGRVLSGALSIVDVPNEEQLAAYTETVYRNCPYSDKLLSGAASAEPTAIPNRVGDPSPIKHVIYIIKENRTYDQVFGDMPRGNGDPSLVLFGREVTPNHHKLAEEFVLLDNLYCNGHVSADGHPWSTMAYNTDYTARNWALTYSRREGIEDDEENSLSRAPSGYIWDACARLGLSYRSYGEYGRRVSQADGTFRVEGAVPGLVGHTCPTFGVSPVAGQPWRDTDNVEVFLKEFREYEKKGNLPRFIVMSLGEDHTTGTQPGTFTPKACVASNDLALGRLVEALSHSKLWPQMAIFVIEDDAQNGPDHVDAHRTLGLVISPYAKRRILDSTQYTTVSMLRTMELVLGIPPLSQFDAAAQPMFACFTDKPNLTPYQHEKARSDLKAKNDELAYGAERSKRMDFSEYDNIDDFELNEILWRAVKGRDAPVPPPVRRAIAYRARSTE